MQPVAATQETQKTLRGTQTQDVSDWQGFVNAMNDSSVGTINLTGDITVANKGTNVNGIKRPNPVINGGKMNLTGSNISGGLIIDGQNHAINFGANYLSFDTNNQKDSNPWDIDFKNLTINADGYDNSWSTYGGAFSPIYMGGDDINTDLLAKNKVTFENVTADIKNGAFYTTTMAKQAGDDPYTTVTFKGNNNITVEAVNVAGDQLYNYSSAVSADHIIFADGTNTVFNVGTAKTNNDQNPGGNILRAKIEDSDDTDPAIDVQKGATVTLNGKSTDVKGMLVNSATTGTVQVDGDLNANMADGSSIAIWAGNLNIGKTGVVNIDTKQSNDGKGSNGVTNYNGYHYAPISLGVGFAFNVTNADSNVLDNAGTLVIKRAGDNKSTSPLISFGSGNGTGSIFAVNVQDGATLDLQDSAQSSIAGTTTNTPNIGLITMWGSGSANSSDTINITNPAYVNFQRTGSQTGTLLRLENQVNHVNIQSNGANNPLPLAQWDEGNYNNPSYYWYINNLTTQNNWGNNSISGFAGQGQTVGANKAGEAKFLHSNGTVTMGGSQAGLNQYQYTDGTITQGQPNPGVDYETPYLNKFLNNFNWWTPQRISMGTNLENKVTPTDAEKYQPVVQTIDGNTNQTLNDLTAKDGIKGLLSSDGTVTTDLSSVKNVNWYDAATDATEWKNIMGNEAEPTNPTGNLKTSDKSAWAKVTYTDGSVDFANIPLNITQPMSETYTPSYKPVNVEQGQTATVDPSFTTQDDKDATAPTGTTFTTGTDTPDWATIDPSTGTVTVKPGTDVTPGAYNVPVTVTYPDKSTDETTVPVIVTKAGQTVTWGDNGAVVTTVDTSKLNAHETTENSQVLSAAGVVTAEGYELTDGKISTTTTPITIDPSTVRWSTTPDTNVDTATAAGKEITTSVNVDFTNNDAAKNILGSKDGVVTTNPFTIDAKGAGSKNVTTPVNVDLGSDLTSEQFGQLVDNNIPTDEIASTTWATKPDANGQGGVIKITFTDKDANGNPTYLNINIPASSIKVTTDADKNTPTGQDVSTKVGEVPDAEKGIKNPGSLPSGTTYTWQDTPDTTKPGKKPAVVVVTYPDGSKDEVPVTIHVTNPATDADKYTPEGQDVNTKTGVVPDPADGIKNKSDLPDGTKYTWKDTPDVTTAGDKPATVVVSYPDGSKDEVPVTIHVTNLATDADKYTPEGQDVNTKTGELPNPADGIKNKSDLPDGTKYTWKDTPDVSTEGNKPATIVVTYPDGSKDEVPVTIHVTNPATDADKYTPETQPITTPEGKVPDASDGIKNKTDLPNDTKYTWTDPDQVAQDVKKPGSHTETITVRYPDGSEDTVTVTVNVPAPEGQNITTDQGKLPNPADAIKNKDQMPDGTTYTWKQEPDVSTPGDHTGVVEVHFPDGTTYEVTVDVHVDAVTPDNGGNMNSGNGSIDHQNGTEINNGTATKTDNGSVIENVTENSVTNSTSQQPAKTLPQTGNDSSKFSALAGLSLAAFASLFGFAGHDKKRKADK